MTKHDDDSAHVHWCHCCIYLDALASRTPGTALSNCCYLTRVAKDQDRDRRRTGTKRECFFFFSVIVSFLHPSLSQPHTLFFFFFYVVLRCFSVWSLLSLMLSCVVHRWKTKKRNILQSFYVNIPSKGCVFFQNANRLGCFVVLLFFFRRWANTPPK